MVNPVYIDSPLKGKDIKLSLAGSRGAEIQKALESKAKMLGKVRGYEYKGPTSLRHDSNRFVPPIYDLSEVARAADIEPYITQSIRKHREQILKEGYLISGTEEDAIGYVKNRLFEISLLTGVTTEQWLRELVTNLITYHNAFLIFRRDAKRSSGKPIRMYGKTRDPIAGIFVGDPTTMEVKADKYGMARKWRQRIEGASDSEVTANTNYNTEDVVHITVDKKTGFTFGTPYLLPVLDDIRALRKLEEVAIIIASKEAFPLYHYKVGTESKPAINYEGGGDEIEEVTAQVASLPNQGFVVSSERHEIKLISSEGSALDLAPYLDYFEARVVAGLRLSPLDLGRGGSTSRGTATNLNQGLQDSAKDYQQVLSDCLTQFVILPLLLEGGFDVTEDTLVKFAFPTINREEERAFQNHGLQLYMGNVISATEFRKTYLNKQPMSDEDVADTQMAKQDAAAEKLAQIGAAARAAARPSSGSDKSTKSTSAQISNKGQPKNQHGTKPAKSRFKANDYVQQVKDKFSTLKATLVNNILDCTEQDSFVEDLFREFIKASTSCSHDFINEQIDTGYFKARKDYSHLYPDEDLDFEDIGNRARTRFFDNFITKSYWKQLAPFKDRVETLLKGDLEGNIDTTRLLASLGTIDDNINILIRDQGITAERFGFIKFAKKIGSKTIDLVNPDDQERATLDISNLIYKTFIPTNDTIDHYLGFSGSEEQ